MVKVVLHTRWSTYEGKIELVTASGEQIRLLDALNGPSRLRRPDGRTGQALQLVDAKRTRGVLPISIELGEVFIRPDRIVAAYDVEPLTTRGPKSDYERDRHSRIRQPIKILLDNGWRVEGHVGEGAGALCGGRTERPFVACTDLLLIDPHRNTRTHLPFLALNASWVEACSAGS